MYKTIHTHLRGDMVVIPQCVGVTMEILWYRR